MKDSDYIRSMLIVDKKNVPEIKEHNKRLLKIAERLKNLERLKKND